MLLVENWPRAVPMVVAGIGAAVPSCGLHPPTLIAPCRVVVSTGGDADLLQETPAADHNRGMIYLTSIWAIGQ